jgi:hypothetical protein
MTKRRRRLLALVALPALLALALVRGCGCDPRCLRGTYRDHCEGPIAYACQGGGGPFNFAPPRVNALDCRRAAEGPGTCVEIPTNGGDTVWAGCRTPCDPATYVPHCEGETGFNCQNHDGGSFEVNRHVQCYGGYDKCAVVDDKGVRRAACVMVTPPKPP